VPSEFDNRNRLNCCFGRRRIVRNAPCTYGGRAARVYSRIIVATSVSAPNDRGGGYKRRNDSRSRGIRLPHREPTVLRTRGGHGRHGRG